MSEYVLKVMKPFLIVYDLNLGGESVANDIENIIKKLEERFKLNLDIDDSYQGMMIIYRNNEGEYWRVCIDESGVVFVNPTACMETLGEMFLEKIYNGCE